MNARVAIRLEESPSGHLLLDLSKDWMSNSVSLEQFWNADSQNAPPESGAQASQQYMPREFASDASDSCVQVCADLSSDNCICQVHEPLSVFAVQVDTSELPPPESSPEDISSLVRTVRSLETLSSPLPRSGHDRHDLIGRAEEQGEDQGQGQGSPSASGGTLGLQPLSGHRRAGSQSLWWDLRRRARASTLRSGFAIGSECPRRVDCVSGVRHPVVVHPSLRSDGPVQVCGSSPIGCSTCPGEHEVQARDEGSPGRAFHPRDRNCGGRGQFAEALGSTPADERSPTETVLQTQEFREGQASGEHQGGGDCESELDSECEESRAFRKQRFKGAGLGDAPARQQEETTSHDRRASRGGDRVEPSDSEQALLSVDAQKLIEQHALELMHMNRFDWLDCEGLFQLMEQLWTKEKQQKKCPVSWSIPVVRHVCAWTYVWCDFESQGISSYSAIYQCLYAQGCV